MKQTKQDTTTRLARIRAEADREFRARVDREERERRRAARRRRHWLERAALFALTVVVLGALPFVALVRGSVFLHQAGDLPTWLALFAGAILTAAIVAAYAAWLARRITGKMHLKHVGRWFAVPLVTFYALYAMIYISSVNLKEGRLRTHYVSLHPLLRVALATLILVDDKLVLTDLARTPEDYARLGLPRREASLHYRQRDGWVHAVDLRTAGRGWVRNTLTELYFAAMGFTTLRHVGTADHLHVSLPVKPR